MCASCVITSYSIHYTKLYDPELIVKLQRRLLDLGVDRHSYVVAIGGGAVLDAVGFVAATTHRGVRHIRVPTTVLAQNDSGVGVKNGINAFGVKNFIGTFAPPVAVLNDFDFLSTLERRDQIAGMAEAVKVSLIRDASFFAWLRITSYNVCYTKLLRTNRKDIYDAMKFIQKTIGAVPSPVITSYSIHYTKLYDA